MREGAACAKMLLAVEVSELDRRFHDDIMGEEGKWWEDDTKRPLPFRTLWRMLEQRTNDVCGNYLSPEILINHWVARRCRAPFALRHGPSGPG